MGAGRGKGKPRLPLVPDPHEVPGADLLVERDDVRVAHEHAPRTQGLAYLVLVRRAVDVHIALVGVDVSALVDSRLKAPQPQDPARDQPTRPALVRSELRVVPAGGDAALEHHACGLSRTYPLGDFVEAPGSPQRMGDIRRRLLGSRYQIRSYNAIIAPELQRGGAYPHNQDAVCVLDAERRTGFVERFPRRTHGDFDILHGRYRRRHRRRRSRVAAPP